MTGPQPKVFEAHHDRYRKSARKEKEVARRLGGRVQTRSGALPWSAHDRTTAGGDITTPDLHIEHKRIEPGTGSIGIKREWLTKVTEGAVRRLRVPAMALHFEGSRGHTEDWLLLPLDFAERLLAAWRAEEG